MTEYGGIATICGRQFGFPVDQGIGLVRLDGNWTLVEFNCPLESLPPRGVGLVTSQKFRITFRGSEMFLTGQANRPVHMGEEIK